MPIAVALNYNIQPYPQDNLQNEAIIELLLTLSGSFPNHGDTLSFSGVSGIDSNALPSRVEIFEATPAPGPAYGGAFIFLPGTNQNNGIMEIFNGTTETTATAGTYASLSLPATFVLRCRAWFPRNL